MPEPEGRLASAAHQLSREREYERSSGMYGSQLRRRDKVSAARMTHSQVRVPSVHPCVSMMQSSRNIVCCGERRRTTTTANACEYVISYRQEFLLRVVGYTIRTLCCK